MKCTACLGSIVILTLLAIPSLTKSPPKVSIGKNSETTLGLPVPARYQWETRMLGRMYGLRSKSGMHTFSRLLLEAARRRERLEWVARR